MTYDDRMRFAFVLLCLAACHSSADSAKKKAPEAAGLMSGTSPAVDGYGVHLVPVPSTSGTLLPNGTVIFGPLETAAKPTKINNVAVKKGTPPTMLEPHREGAMTVYSDDAADTTRLALGIDQTTFAGVLKEATVSPRVGAWTIVADGKEQVWKPGQRIDVGADGHFQLIEAP